MLYQGFFVTFAVPGNPMRQCSLQTPMRSSRGVRSNVVRLQLDQSSDLRVNERES